ncbi:MAG: GTP 3',8-cyclase MoaA [Methanomassiliicoccales archaeon]|nr:GTP 3',8-cyclase MoaA [Methanomassiliicoccales archaeon]
MKDSYGREMTNLRISITQRCNLRCLYCHREGEASPGEEMTPEEISRLVAIGSSMGMKKLKITGGEPLVRDDILEVIRLSAKYAGEVSLTTNGVLLPDLSSGLKEAGLRRVNVSLDTLDPDTYRTISGVDALERVIEGIRSAVSAGLSPVKLNMVVMKDVNSSEIDRMIEFSRDVGAVLQLIELEAPRERINDGYYAKYHYDLDGVEGSFASRAVKIVPRDLHRRMKYFLPEEVEVVRPMHNTVFCANCHRLRITSDGRLKPCLLNAAGMIDVLGPMRSGKSDSQLAGLFHRAVESREPYWR